MKEFKQGFIEALQQAVNQFPGSSILDPSIEMCQEVSLAEAEAKTLLNSDSISVSLHLAIHKQLAKAIGIGPSSENITREIITAAFFTAAGVPELIKPKAILFGQEYQQMIASVKPALTKMTPVVQLYCESESGDGQITAYTSNGKSIIRHACPCYVQGPPFTAYINNPHDLPAKLETVVISLDGLDTVITYGDHISRYNPPITGLNLQQVWVTAEELLSEGRTRTVMNPGFLRELAAGMRAGTLIPAPVHISVGSGDEPIVAKCGPTEALVMPVRTSAS